MVRLVATVLLACLLLLAPAKRSEARRYGAALRAYAKAERDAALASAPADVLLRGTADGYDSLFAGDPVIQAIEDAVNS